MGINSQESAIITPSFIFYRYFRLEGSTSILRNLRQPLDFIKNKFRIKKKKKDRYIIYNRTKIEPPRSIGPCKYYLSVAAIVKNEGSYLQEWIEFHRMLGVEHFVIYDNGSTDESHDILCPYIQQGLVDYIPWSNFLDQANHQHLAYTHASAHLTGTTRWLAFLDLDEFLYSPAREEISAILAEKEHYPAIVVHLSDFGPSGHQTKPEGLVIENYTKRLEHNRYIQLKSIVQPHLVRGVNSASLFTNTVDGGYGSDENGEPVISYDQVEYSAKRLRINHYMTRSIEEFERKMSRRYFWREKNNARKKIQKTKEYSIGLEASVHDDDILYYVQDLKQRLLSLEKASA